MPFKPTAIASVASRGVRAEGEGSFAAEASPRSPSGEREGFGEAEPPQITCNTFKWAIVSI